MSARSYALIQRKPPHFTFNTISLLNLPSLIYNKNNNGPKTGPCATLVITWPHSEIEPFIRLQVSVAYRLTTILSNLIFCHLSREH